MGWLTVVLTLFLSMLSVLLVVKQYLQTCHIGLDKSGYQVNIFLTLYFFTKNICCGYSLVAPHRGASKEYPQHMFL